MKKVIVFLFILINRVVFFLNNVSITKMGNVSGLVFIKNKGSCVIGPGFNANSGSIFNPIGGDSICRIVIKVGASLNIGKNFGISNSTIFCERKICIGDNVVVGGGCKIWDTDFHPLDTLKRRANDQEAIARKSVSIGNDVWIGGGCIILKGVSIGNSSVIGAGSVVTKNIESNEIWAGNPAKFIRNTT